MFWGLGLDPGDARRTLGILRGQAPNAEGSECSEQHLPQGVPGPSLHSRSLPALEADVVPDVPASLAVLIHLRLPAAPHILRAPSEASRFHLLPASRFRWASKGLCPQSKLPRGCQTAGTWPLTARARMKST